MKWERIHQPSEILEWVGLPTILMKDYQTVINRKTPGICGTYCVAVLSDIVARQHHLELPEIQQLVSTLEQRIEYFFPYLGTYWWDVQRGLNHLWSKYGYRSTFALFSEVCVPNLLDQSIPVIVGTTRVLGSPYGNHWLVVYAYAYDSKGKLWYKAYDNHGSIEAVIPAVQTIGAIWLSKL